VTTLLEIGKFLLEHADLIDDIYEVLASGGSKESLKAAIRALKVKASDDIFHEELFADGSAPTGPRSGAV